MTETIISMELPAGGHLAIRRNRIRPEGEERNLSRISLVSGIHGDELEGQYICYETARRVKEHPEYLKGIVDMGTQGLEVITNLIDKVGLLPMVLSGFGATSFFKNLDCSKIIGVFTLKSVYY